jgi:hypothetical protein
MAKTSITLTHGRASDYQGKASMPARDAAHRFERLLSGCVGGAYPGATGFTVDTGPATGTITLAGGADDVVPTIGGVIGTATVAGATDADTATALAESINANAGQSALVTAEADGAVVTLTSKVNGATGNFSLSVSTQAGTATVSGATLTGGATSTYTF